MPAVCEMVQPKAILVLNLFRDQLDRYGELDSTAKLIGKGIAATKAKVYLNADDPLVASLSKYAKKDNVVFFGVNQANVQKLPLDVTADSGNCPQCGLPLVYTQAYFGHIGHYQCAKKHFTRPTPDFGVTGVELALDHVSFQLEHDEDITYEANLPGLYNIYNAAAAVSLAVDQGIAPAQASRSLEQTEAAFGRVEKMTVKDRTLYLLLVKNPTGFNQVLQTFLLQEKQQNLLIAINDNFADGRDVSWLWDVAFEELKPKAHLTGITGLRATDMALRLKYADIPTEFIQTDLKKALNQFIAQIPAGGVGYIVPTYTAMLSIRRLLGRMTRLKGVWE